MEIEIKLRNTKEFIKLIEIVKELISDEGIAEEVRVKYMNKVENIINNAED